MLFHVRSGAVGAWSTVHVVGEVDLASAPAYRKSLLDAAELSVALAVDLTHCDLIDSVGLGITLGAARRMADAGGSFAVVAAGSVARTFQRCRLDEILSVVESLGVLDEFPRTPNPAPAPVSGGR